MKNNSIYLAMAIVLSVVFFTFRPKAFREQSGDYQSGYHLAKFLTSSYCTTEPIRPTFPSGEWNGEEFDSLGQVSREWMQGWLDHQRHQKSKLGH